MLHTPKQTPRSLWLGGAALWLALLAAAFAGRLPLLVGQWPVDPLAANSPADSGLTLRSSAFAPGAAIPVRHTADDLDISPPLSWDNAPQGVQQWALIMDDPDAPRKEPWVHWVIYGLAADVTSLPEALPRQPRLIKPLAALQGVGSLSTDHSGYRGPGPPPGKVHHYRFTLYALDRALTLEPGLSKQQLLAAMDGHILERTVLVGTYHR